MKNFIAGLMMTIIFSGNAFALEPLVIRKQGVFSSGGTVTAPISGISTLRKTGSISHAPETHHTLTTLTRSIRFQTAKTQHQSFTFTATVRPERAGSQPQTGAKAGAIYFCVREGRRFLLTSREEAQQVTPFKSSTTIRIRAQTVQSSTPAIRHGIRISG